MPKVVNSVPLVLAGKDWAHKEALKINRNAEAILLAACLIHLFGSLSCIACLPLRKFFRSGGQRAGNQFSRETRNLLRRSDVSYAFRYAFNGAAIRLIFPRK
jgi:hypothetical protein